MKYREQIIDEIASAIWIAEAKRCHGPNRTIKEWEDQSEETHSRYWPLAEAAWEVMARALITGVQGFLPNE